MSRLKLVTSETPPPEPPQAVRPKDFALITANFTLRQRSLNNRYTPSLGASIFFKQLVPDINTFSEVLESYGSVLLDEISAYPKNYIEDGERKLGTVSGVRLCAVSRWTGLLVVERDLNHTPKTGITEDMDEWCSAFKREYRRPLPFRRRLKYSMSFDANAE